MNDLQNINIEELLAERPFELLNPTEKAAVLAQMPDWEYDRLHQLLVKSKATLRQGPLPNPAIRANVLNVLRQQQKPKALAERRTGFLVRLAQYRVPAWQAAAGLALLLAAHFALQKPAVEALRTETVYVNTTDTIYKEMALPVADTSSKIPQKRVNVKPKAMKRPLVNSPAEALADSSSRHQGRYTDMPDTLPGFQLTVQQPSGRSANEMKELWQFLDVVY